MKYLNHLCTFSVGTPRDSHDDDDDDDDDDFVSYSKRRRSNIKLTGAEKQLPENNGPEQIIATDSEPVHIAASGSPGRQTTETTRTD